MPVANVGFSGTTVCDEEGRRSLKRIPTVIGFLKSTGVKQNAKVTMLGAVALMLLPLASWVSTAPATGPSYAKLNVSEQVHSPTVIWTRIMKSEAAQSRFAVAQAADIMSFSEDTSFASDFEGFPSPRWEAMATPGLSRFEPKLDSVRASEIAPIFELSLGFTSERDEAANCRDKVT